MPGHHRTGTIDVHASVTTFDEAVDALYSTTSEPSHWVGYSLGGRLALGVALKYPGAVCTLTLIGANPGLDAELRPSRAQNDERWARRLESEDLAHVMDDWQAQPIFESQQDLPDSARNRQGAARRQLDPRGLARAMRAMSLARMPDHRPQLADISVPVLLVVGARDAKFRKIAESMQNAMPSARTWLAEGVGHNVPLEAPAPLAQAVARFIDGA